MDRGVSLVSAPARQSNICQRRPKWSPYFFHISLNSPFLYRIHLAFHQYALIRIASHPIHGSSQFLRPCILLIPIEYRTIGLSGILDDSYAWFRLFAAIDSTSRFMPCHRTQPMNDAISAASFIATSLSPKESPHPDGRGTGSRKKLIYLKQSIPMRYEN